MASEAWQIGSAKPPTVCLCCGSKFDDDVHKMRGPYENGPYRYVCEWCWKKSYMFFADKKVRGSHFVPPFDKSEVLANAPILELEITNGRTLSVRLVTVPIHAIGLNPENPRVRYRAGKDESEIEDWLWRETGTKNLYNEIKYSGGLSEKPIIDSNFTVVEGNRRVVCLRRLDDQAKNGELAGFSESAFEKTQCFMLPQNVEPTDLALLIARVHVSGKKEWSPLNQAEQIFEMVTKHLMSMKEIGSALSISPKKAEVMLRAFQATLEYGDFSPDMDGRWVHKFSYFYELFRNDLLREWASKPQNLQVFFALISGDKPRIALGNQVRRLSMIVSDPKAFNILKSDGFDKAFDRVTRKQSQIDEYTKALEQASQTLLKMSRGSVRLTTKKAKVLGDIKHHVDSILLKKSSPLPSSRAP